jgi:hypothetical protein
VGDNGTLLEKLPAGSYSASCAGTTTVFDGYAGSTYTRLALDSANPQSAAAICYRVDPGSGSPKVGGRLDIGTATPSPSLPSLTVDTNYTACSSASGNTFPGTHPIASNTLLGNTQMIDGYANAGGDVWLCLQAAPLVGNRVVAKPSAVGGLSGPITNSVDTAPIGSPAPRPGPSGYPSTTCQNGAGAVQALNANIGASQVWLYGWRETPTKIDLCVRVQNANKSTGGKLTLDAPSNATLVPPSISSDATPCTQLVDTVSAEGVTVTIKSSPASANPGSVCVSSSALPQPVVLTAGFTGNPIPPSPTWTPDP